VPCAQHYAPCRRRRRRCDKITISPALLSELEACHEPLPRKLSPDQARSEDARLERFDAATFDQLHGADEMAVEKLKQVGLARGVGDDSLACCVVNVCSTEPLPLRAHCAGH
jgi:hypothetical protein